MSPGKPNTTRVHRGGDNMHRSLFWSIWLGGFVTGVGVTIVVMSLCHAR